MPAPEMLSDARAQHWQTVFRQRAEGQVSWFQEHPRTSLDSITRTGVSPSASIVDVGAGASRLVDALLDAGYLDVTVVDIASSALVLSRERLARRAEAVKWLVRDLRTWIPDKTFDVWHDRAVFHFMVEPEDRSAYLATMRRAVKRGGHVILATFATNGPERCSGLPVRRYEPATLAATLGADFRLVESLHEEHETPAGIVQAFQYSRFQRAP